GEWNLAGADRWIRRFMRATVAMKRRKSPRSMSLASSLMSWGDTRKAVSNRLVMVFPITSIPLCGNAKKPAHLRRALDEKNLSPFDVRRLWLQQCIHNA